MKVIIDIAEDEVIVALKRLEGYEDIHPELLVEDARIQWPDYRVVQIHLFAVSDLLGAIP